MKLFSFITIFSMIIAMPVICQEDETSGSSQDFFLIPILETVFSQNVKWRPDWPSDIPPDGFLARGGNYSAIELSNDKESFSVTLSSEGQLLEFPFFMTDSYAKTDILYDDSGFLQSITLSIKKYPSSNGNGDQSAQSNDNSGTQSNAQQSQSNAQQSNSQSNAQTNGQSNNQSDTQSNGQSDDDKNITVTFPENFLPYSDLSPGGAFPVVTVSSGSDSYYVFIFESPLFLSETWFDGNGNMVSFCKASVNVENGAWRIRSIEIHSKDGTSFIDYFFDSFGNITEIRQEDSVYSSFYAGDVPNYWNCGGIQYDFFWDMQKTLTVVKTTDENGGFLAEYRYQYETDSSGNWVKRLETAYAVSMDLLAPAPSSGGGTWDRQITYFD